MKNVPAPAVPAHPAPEPVLTDAASPRWPGLTDREAEVADLLAAGVSNSAAAKLLDVSIKTIDTHRRHALKKLGLAGNVALAREAIRRGASTQITAVEKREWT